MDHYLIVKKRREQNKPIGVMEQKDSCWNFIGLFK